MLVATPAMSPPSSGRNIQPCSRVHMNGGVKLPAASPGTPAKPTTSPRSLIIIGVFQKGAAFGLTSTVGSPLSQSTACLPVGPPTAKPQLPEIPTIWPRSLMAVAAPEVSPAGRGSAWISARPGPQTTGLNCSTCGLMQLASCTLVSAQPTVCARLLVPVAKPLVPPSVGSGRMPVNGSHTKPRQTLKLGLLRKKPQLQPSLLGSS